MKKSSEFFIYALMVTFAFTLLCGGRSGEIKFYQNFELCIILIAIAIGLALYGAYIFRKEKKSKSLK